MRAALHGFYKGREAPLMRFDIVELAAWIIVSQAVIRIFVRTRDDRNKRIEKASVIAEYDEISRTEHLVQSDENLSEFNRDRMLRGQRERQRELQLRYPQYLVRSPGAEFLQKAVKVDNNRSDKWTWSQFWAFLFGTLVFASLFLVVKYVWAFLIQWFHFGFSS